MTVAELIAQLQTFDPALPVCYEDYEQGPCDVDTVGLASERHRLLGIELPYDDEEYVSLA